MFCVPCRVSGGGKSLAGVPGSEVYLGNVDADSTLESEPKESGGDPKTGKVGCRLVSSPRDGGFNPLAAALAFNLASFRSCSCHASSVFAFTILSRRVSIFRRQ